MRFGGRTFFFGFRPAIERRGEEPSEEVVDGSVKNERGGEEGERKMNGSGAKLSMEDWRGVSEIDVERGIGSARTKDGDGGEDTFKAKGATVIPKAADGPNQNHGKDDVVERNQTQPERVVLVEHVVGAADEACAEEQAPGDVKNPKQAYEGDGQGLAGNEKRALNRETDAAEQDGEVAKEENVCGSPVMPIDGHPNDQKHCSGQTDAGGNRSLLGSEREHGACPMRQHTNRISPVTTAETMNLGGTDSIAAGARACENFR